MTEQAQSLQELSTLRKLAGKFPKLDRRREQSGSRTELGRKRKNGGKDSGSRNKGSVILLNQGLLKGVGRRSRRPGLRKERSVILLNQGLIKGRRGATV